MYGKQIYGSTLSECMRKTGTFLYIEYIFIYEKATCTYGKETYMYGK